MQPLTAVHEMHTICTLFWLHGLVALKSQSESELLRNLKSESLKIHPRLKMHGADTLLIPGRCSYRVRAGEAMKPVSLTSTPLASTHKTGENHMLFCGFFPHFHQGCKFPKVLAYHQFNQSPSALTCTIPSPPPLSPLSPCPK